MVDIRITYETLFDLLRREKNREELQSIDKDFYEQVLAYLMEKKEAITKKGDELFVSAEREKLKIQFQNIRRIIKELFERREKKIITMAVSRVRTGSDVIDTSALLPSEKEFFEEQLTLLSKYKENVLNNILHLKEFNNGNEKKEESKTPAGADEEEAETATEAKEEVKEESEKKEEVTTKEKNKETVAAGAEPERQEETDNLKKVKILDSIPKFVGLQGEVIGPFNEGDQAELEPAIADLLVKKGSAEEC